MRMETPDTARADGRRALPSVDQLLNAADPALAAALPHALLVSAARESLAEARGQVAAGGRAPDLAGLVGALEARARAAAQPSLRPVINAGGVIIQTNLGRAPLSQGARAAMVAAAAYSNLEYDLERGARGSRYAHAAPLIARLTGAEDGLVVNNAAAALYFVLLACAAGREVVLSRGQAVEIGGGFRIPDILRQSGATLVEVGTTNRTYARDYEAALTERTAGLLRVHTSNFRVLGFTHTVPAQELAALAHAHGLWLTDDVGSGALLPTEAYGLTHEPMPQESIAAGADLVLFSGDKLLGGPQAGIIAGRADLIALLRRHPLARALRVDKLTYAALEATLLAYVRGEAPRDVPVWVMISADPAALEARARRWAATLAAAGLPVAVVPGRSAVGGGTLPGETLPTWLLAIGERMEGAVVAPADPDGGEDGEPRADAGPSAAALARRLRAGSPAVVARVERDLVLCDSRTVLPDEDAALLGALQAAWRG
jgi:L-seryl-tRNA(Ser) seleniumtransferase